LPHKAGRPERQRSEKGILGREETGQRRKKTNEMSQTITVFVSRFSGRRRVEGKPESDKGCGRGDLEEKEIDARGKAQPFLDAWECRLRNKAQASKG